MPDTETDLNAVIVDTVTSLVVVLDREGRITRFNHACEKLSGYLEAELLGRLAWEVLAVPAESEAVRRAFLEARDGRLATTNARVWVTRDGTRRLISWDQKTVCAEDGRVSHIVGTGTDITESPAAEKALCWERAKLERLAACGLIGMISSRPDGTITEANDVFLEMIGYRREELLLRKTWESLTPPEYVHANKRAVNELALNGICTPFENEYFRKDGTRVPVLIAIAMVEGLQTAAICFVLDITRRKKAERDLQEVYALHGKSEARFRRLMEANFVGVMFFHLDGRVLDANTAFLNTVGYTRADLRAGLVRWSGMTPSEYLDRDLRGVQELRQTGVCTPFEKEYIRKDGSRVPILIGAAFLEQSPDEGVSFVVDMTDLRRTDKALQQAYEALRENEERFRLAVMNSPDLMFHQDRELVFTWFSRTIPPITQADVIGKTDNDVVDPEQARHLIEVKRRVMRTGQGERVENAIRIGQTLRHFESALECRRDSRGLVIGIAGYVRDITERKQSEEALRAANDSLRGMSETLERRVAERTAAAEQRSLELALSERRLRESEGHYRELADHNRRLVRELEHRVRNNLSGLLGLIGAMRDKAADVGVFADAIDGRLRAMAHVHQLLASTGWQPVSLRDLVDSTLATMKHMAPYPASVDADGPIVLVAPGQAMPLILVLLEWFTNSCKYGAHRSPDGNVRISWEAAGSDTRSSLVRLEWRETGGPPVIGPVVPSLGTELVRGFVTRELRGSCDLRFPPGGACHVIEFHPEPTDGAH